MLCCGALDSGAAVKCCPRRASRRRFLVGARPGFRGVLEQAAVPPGAPYAGGNRSFSSGPSRVGPAVIRRACRRSIGTRRRIGRAAVGHSHAVGPSAVEFGLGASALSPTIRGMPDGDGGRCRSNRERPTPVDRSDYSASMLDPPDAKANGVRVVSVPSLRVRDGRSVDRVDRDVAAPAQCRSVRRRRPPAERRIGLGRRGRPSSARCPSSAVVWSSWPMQGPAESVEAAVARRWRRISEAARPAVGSVPPSPGAAGSAVEARIPGALVCADVAAAPTDACGSTERRKIPSGPGAGISTGRAGAPRIDNYRVGHRALVQPPAAGSSGPGKGRRGRRRGGCRGPGPWELGESAEGESRPALATADFSESVVGRTTDPKMSAAGSFPGVRGDRGAPSRWAPGARPDGVPACRLPPASARSEGATRPGWRPATGVRRGRFAEPAGPAGRVRPGGPDPGLRTGSRHGGS